MKRCCSVILLLFLSLNVVAQKKDTVKLPYITSYPVYIDGGCSFFNEVNIPLQEHKYQLIISAYKVAFIQIGAYRSILFKRRMRVKTSKGYIDYYKGKDGSFVLTIDSIIKTPDHSSIRRGTLTLKTKNIIVAVKIQGKVDEIDTYNGYTERQIHPRH